jgi:hypothetical protein
MKRICGECEFFNPLLKCVGDSLKGQCQFNPPVFNGPEPGDWPVVYASWWCGQFKAKRKAKA